MGIVTTRESSLRAIGANYFVLEFSIVKCG